MFLAGVAVVRSRLGRGSVGRANWQYVWRRHAGRWVGQPVPELADVCLVSCVSGIAYYTVGLETIRSSQP